MVLVEINYSNIPALSGIEVIRIYILFHLHKLCLRLAVTFCSWYLLIFWKWCARHFKQFQPIRMHTFTECQKMNKSKHWNSYSCCWLGWSVRTTTVWASCSWNCQTSLFSIVANMFCTGHAPKQWQRSKCKETICLKWVSLTRCYTCTLA